MNALPIRVPIDTRFLPFSLPSSSTARCTLRRLLRTFTDRASGADRARIRDEVGARAILPSPTDASPGIETRVLTAPSWPRHRVERRNALRRGSPRLAPRRPRTPPAVPSSLPPLSIFHSLSPSPSLSSAPHCAPLGV